MRVAALTIAPNPSFCSNLIDIFQRLLRVSLLDGVEVPASDLVRGLVEDQPQDDELQVGAQRRVSVDRAHDVQQS